MREDYVVVTGAAGFIGSRLASRLLREGIRVQVVDDPEHFRTRSEHPALGPGEPIAPPALFDWLSRQEAAPRAFFHLGACTDTTETDESYLTKVNLEYSQEVWKYCSEAGCPLIYASSAATYGDGTLGYDDREDLIPRLKPLNLYGWSKQNFDLWVLAQRGASAPSSWCGFKFFNVYGYGERHKGKMASVVLQAFDQIRSSGHVKLFKSHRLDIADGEQKRDFIYVDDVVDVLIWSAQNQIKNGIYNLGTGQARSFLDLVKATFMALELTPDVRFIDTPSNLRNQYQYFTEAKMARLRALGYLKPFTSLEDGVRLYVEELLAFQR